MIYKLSLAFLVATASIAAMEVSPSTIPLDDLDTSNMTLVIPSSQVRTQNIKNKIDLFYDENGFVVKEGETFKRVHSYDTDSSLRKRNLKTIAKYVCLNKLKISKFDNGEYAVRAHGELMGGGIGGAAIGAHVGMVATNVVGHGVLMLISSFAGPVAGPAVYSGLAATYGPAILAASKGVAIGVGIVGGVATGPV